MYEQMPVYVFRRGGFARALDTNVSVAPRDFVVAAFGGGGVKDSDGLFAAFGGGVVFKNEQTGIYYLGVWGARNASRFRAALRRLGVPMHVIRQPCPGRLIFYGTRDKRSSGRRLIDHEAVS